jgi:polysaccharide export outer membrane protein
LASADCDLFTALVAAGGLADDASTMVEIRRPGLSTGDATLASYPPRVPASSMLRSDHVDLLNVDSDRGNLRLDDGSVVMVVKQPKRTVQVIGLVQQPSEVQMPTDRNMRLLDAIAQAGGLTIQVANKVRIIRHVPGELEPVVIQTSIRDAKLQGDANVLLAAGDVVSVEETPATFTVEMLRSFIRFGFTSSIPGM